MEIVGGKFDCNCSDILVQTRQPSGAGDGNNPRLLGEQPGECYLSRRRLIVIALCSPPQLNQELLSGTRV